MMHTISTSRIIKLIEINYLNTKHVDTRQTWLHIDLYYHWEGYSQQIQNTLSTDGNQADQISKLEELNLIKD